MFNLDKVKNQLTKYSNKLSIGILGSVAAIAPQTAESQDRQIEEVVVSATKKDESASDIPVTVTALTEETLKEMNVSNFDEYVEYLPNVTSGGRGPGQSTIYIRGLAVDPVNVFLSAAQGSSPNVALYLDEQPVQVPGRNLDVYVADMERIEVLPGPQGTLFGASSQAGTVRLITNKPKFDTQEGGFNGSLFNTSNGDMSSSFDAFINVPMSDTWAIRGVLYNSNSGGYIDNVAGTWNSIGKGSFDGYKAVSPDQQLSSDPTEDVNGKPVKGFVAAPGGTAYITDHNNHLVEQNFNDSSYEGFRISSAHKINDDWDLLLTHMDQTIEADGVWDYDPAVGDLQVQRFSPDSLEDTFNQTSLTLEGRLGKLDVVYTGSVLDRQAEQTVDYSGYVNAGAYMPYYTCNYYTDKNNTPDVTSDDSTVQATVCGSGVVDLYLHDDNERTTHEFRVASSELNELPFSYTAGVFIEESVLKTENDYGYQGFLDAYPTVAYDENGNIVPNTVVPGVYSNNGRARDPQYRFFNDLKRTDDQTAFFAELTYPLTEKTDILVGARRYDLEIDYVGQSKFGGIAVGDGVRDYNSSGGHTDQPLVMKDTITKITISHKIDDDTLVYFTQSEGYRPGGYNRGGGLTNSCAAVVEEVSGEWVAKKPATYCGPAQYTDADDDTHDIEAYDPELYRANVGTTFESDEVLNTEIGIKTVLDDGRMRINATYYSIDWTGIQVSQFDPANISILTFVENAADAEVSGFEADMLWYPSDSWTVAAAVSLNDTEIVKDVSQTVPIVDIGSPLPLSPSRQYHLRLRKDMSYKDNPAYVQFAYKSANETYNSFESAKVLEQDGYQTMDLAFGMKVNDTDIEFFVRNLTDERANLYYNDQDDIPRITTNRPRNMGVRISRNF